MAFVYIIQDEISHKHYIGSCLDLFKRINRHKQHTGSSTTRNGNWKLICYKELANLSEARTLEKKVKSYKGGNAFKKIINGDVAEWIKHKQFYVLSDSAKQKQPMPKGRL